MSIRETRWLLNQLIWKILFKIEHFPKDRVENRKYLSCHHPNNFVRKFHGLPKYPGLKKHLWVRKSMIDQKKTSDFEQQDEPTENSWTKCTETCLKLGLGRWAGTWGLWIGRYLSPPIAKLWSIRNSSQSGGVQRNFHDHRELGWNTSMVFSGTPLLWREIMMIIPYIKECFFKITFPLKLFCKPSSPKNFSRFAWIHHSHLEDSEAL